MTDRRAFATSVFCQRSDKKVLLIKHKRLGLWLPPGGEREGDELPIDTGRREVLEETQLEVTFPLLYGAVHSTPPGFLGYEELENKDKGLHMNFAFVGRVYGEPVSDGSWEEHRWVDPVDAQGSPELATNVLDRLWQIATTRFC